MDFAERARIGLMTLKRIEGGESPNDEQGQRL
jgi:hypothetical protein